MRPRLRLLLPSLLGIAAGVGAAGCGDVPGRVILFVHGDYAVPDEVDNLEVTIGDPESGEELTTFEVELEEGESFPIRLLLEPASTQPRLLSAYVFAREGEVGVAHLWLTFTWEPGRELIANETEELALYPL